MKERERSAGVLMPVFSLPGEYGIGTFGKEAKQFIDFLKETGNSVWQVLPMGPTGYGDSPYQSFSSFAINPYFIDLETLEEEGFLTEEELHEEKLAFASSEEKIRYGLLYERRFPLLRKAYERWKAAGGNASLLLSKLQKETLDYCLFMALKDAFESVGAKARVQSALNMQQIVETYARPKAIQYLEEGKIVIFAAGTGNPFFTTDTAAALRGVEMGCEIMMKATNVEGVYTADPKKDPSATRYQAVTFDEAIQKKLKVMDTTAFTLCQERNLNIVVFSIHKEGALKRVILGEDEGTLVHN